MYVYLGWHLISASGGIYRNEILPVRKSTTYIKNKEVHDNEHDSEHMIRKFKSFLNFANMTHFNTQNTKNAKSPFITKLL